MVVFQSPPLEENIEVTGPITVRLWVSSSAPDTDFTAKLLDIYPPSDDYPDGYHMNLVDTILRCRYRESWTQPAMMTPDEVYPITIPLPPTSNLFKAGHRIRIDISSSNFPPLRREPQHRGADGPTHAHTDRRKHSSSSTNNDRLTSSCPSYPKPDPYTGFGGSAVCDEPPAALSLRAAPFPYYRTVGSVGKGNVGYDGRPRSTLR